MDRTIIKAKHQTAMRTCTGAAFNRLLQSKGRKCFQYRVDASYRRALYEVAVLRFKKAHRASSLRRPACEPKTCFQANGPDGYTGHLPKASNNKGGPRTQKVSLSSSRAKHLSSKPGLVRRHYVHSSTSRILLSSGSHGLVQPIRAIVAAIKLAGNNFLHRRRAGSSRGIRFTQYFQYRSGKPIYKYRLYRLPKRREYRHKHGWTWACIRQHFHREIVAYFEVRGGLPQRLPVNERSYSQPYKLFYLLRQHSASSVAGLQNASRYVSKLAEVWYNQKILSEKDKIGPKFHPPRGVPASPSADGGKEPDSS